MEIQDEQHPVENVVSFILVEDIPILFGIKKRVASKIKMELFPHDRIVEYCTNDSGIYVEVYIEFEDTVKFYFYSINFKE